MPANKSSPQRRATDLAARDRAVMEEIQKGQEERDKKTARLRALRLAKEAADMATAEKAEAERLLAAKRALQSSSSGKKPAKSRQRKSPEAKGSKEQTAHG